MTTTQLHVYHVKSIEIAQRVFDKKRKQQFTVFEIIANSSDDERCAIKLFVDDLVDLGDVLRIKPKYVESEQ